VNVPKIFSKFAVTVKLLFIVIDTLAFVDVDAPDHPINTYPFVGTAVTVTFVPQEYGVA
jgi:hypothetical protein